MTDLLRVLASFDTPAEASVVQSRLEAEGIRAMLGDEYSVGWLWHIGASLKGVKVLVAEEDLRRAREILAEEVSLEEDVDYDGDVRQTPLSGAAQESSDDTHRGTLRAIVFGLCLLLAPVIVAVAFMISSNSLIVTVGVAFVALTVLAMLWLPRDDEAEANGCEQGETSRIDREPDHRRNADRSDDGDETLP